MDYLIIILFALVGVLFYLCVQLDKLVEKLGVRIGRIERERMVALMPEELRKQKQFRGP